MDTSATAEDLKTNERGEKIVAPVPSDAVHIDAQRGVAVPAEAPRTLNEFKGDVDRAVRTAGERRQKMEMVRPRQSAGPTLRSMIVDNKLVLAALAAGLLLAAWQLFRK